MYEFSKNKFNNHPNHQENTNQNQIQCYFMSVIIAASKWQNKSQELKMMWKEKEKLWSIVQWNAKPLWNEWLFLKEIKNLTHWSHLWVYSQMDWNKTLKSICIFIVIAAAFTKARTHNQPKSPLMDTWRKCGVCLQQDIVDRITKRNQKHIVVCRIAKNRWTNAPSPRLMWNLEKGFQQQQTAGRWWPGAWKLESRDDVDHR